MATNAPKYIISLLEEGLQASRMKSASISPNENNPFTGADEFTEQVRDRTRIYRESWVEQPLLVVLAYLKGDIDLEHARRLWLEDTRRIDEDIKDPRIALGLIGANEGYDPS